MYTGQIIDFFNELTSKHNINAKILWAFEIENFEELGVQNNVSFGAMAIARDLGGNARHEVFLPDWILWLPSDVAKFIIAHELAHIFHGDMPLNEKEIVKLKEKRKDVVTNGVFEKRADNTALEWLGFDREVAVRTQSLSAEMLLKKQKELDGEDWVEFLPGEITQMALEAGAIYRFSFEEVDAICAELEVRVSGL